MKFATAVLILVSVAACPQTAASAPDATFPPFQQWMGAVLTGDAATLKSLYSQVVAPSTRGVAKGELPIRLTTQGIG